jgi:hypothetical protein
MLPFESPLSLPKSKQHQEIWLLDSPLLDTLLVDALLLVALLVNVMASTSEYPSPG